MIVDAHVGVSQEQYDAEHAVAALQSAGVARAVIFADANAVDIETQNAYVLQAARTHGLYPFYYIGGNPFTNTRPESLDVPENLSAYAGIRWHRWVGERVDREGILDESELQWAVNLMESPEFEAIASAAAFYDLPVMFEEGLGVTLEFVLRYPALDIIIPHLGAESGGQSNILRALWDRPNVYFETSLSLIDETTLARVGTERLLFGSGYPDGDPELELDKIDRLPIAEGAKENIFGENLLALLSHYEPQT